MTAVITVNHLSKMVGERTVLNNVTFGIRPGERICIIGQSGSGKTLLLRILLGLEQPTQGTVEVDGVPLQTLPPRILHMYRQKSGTIFQEDLLAFHETVFEYIALPLILRNTPPTLTTQITTDTLRSLSLDSHTQFFLKNLSHGERKLAHIARAIVTSPLLLFADEPLQDLDPAQAALVCTVFRRLNKNGTSLILATNDSTLGEKLHCRTLTLHNGQISGEPEPSILPSVTGGKIAERNVRITAVK